MFRTQREVHPLWLGGEQWGARLCMVLSKGDYQLVEWTKAPPYGGEAGIGTGLGSQGQMVGLGIFKELCGDFCFPRKDLSKLR